MLMTIGLINSRVLSFTFCFISMTGVGRLWSDLLLPGIGTMRQFKTFGTRGLVME